MVPWKGTWTSMGVPRNRSMERYQKGYREGAEEGLLER